MIQKIIFFKYCLINEFVRLCLHCVPQRLHQDKSPAAIWRLLSASSAATLEQVMSSIQMLIAIVNFELFIEKIPNFY